MEAITLIGGLALPWLLGIAMVLGLRDARRPLAAPGEIAWLIGAGYLVGAFALTLWMRALSLAGIRFGAVSIALPLALATLVFAYLGGRRHGGGAIAASVRDALSSLLMPPALRGAMRVLWQVALAWLAFRYVVLGLLVEWQPLYPWDAWIQWATKARVWYEEGRVAPFQGGAAWFAAGGAAWTDAAPGYPPTMPLLQAWTCIAIGRWDDSLMNWPWWQMSVALTLALYGALRSLEVPAIGALAGAFLVATLPLANVHVALAGYADLPMAAYYAGATLAFLRWTRLHSFRGAALAALLAIACTQIKVPGIIWALTIVPGFVVALFPRQGLKLTAIGAGALLFALAVLAQTHPVISNYELHLDFAPPWGAIVETHFLLGNWNLLWYGALVAAFLAWRRLPSSELAPMTAIIAADALFLFVVFSFTGPRNWMTEQTTINRATLHAAPIACIFVVLAYRAFAARWIGARTRATAAAAA
jgi:hypothetical protein